MHDDLPQLMTAWIKGWAISRLSPAPVAIPGGFRADIRQPVPGTRYVFHTYDTESLERLGRDLTIPGTGIKIHGRLPELRAALPESWRMDEPACLMTTTFRPGTAIPADPYTIRYLAEGATHVIQVLDADGEIAASARMARGDRYGVIDRVWTRPAHQRRGLGTTMMQLLANRAVELGLSDGVLSASPEGRELYLTLGWTVRAEMAVAFRTPD